MFPIAGWICVWKKPKDAFKLQGLLQTVEYVRVAIMIIKVEMFALYITGCITAKNDEAVLQDRVHPVVQMPSTFRIILKLFAKIN